MNNNKKIFFWFLIFVISSLVLEINYNKEIKKTVVSEQNTKEEGKGGSLLLTSGGGIYSYDFDSGVKKFIDRSFNDRNLRFEKNRLVYISAYNQYSIVNFSNGEKETINVPEIEKNLESGYSDVAEIDTFLIVNDKFIYIYHPCNRKSCYYSIRVYDTKLKETKIIKDDIDEILPHGGLELMFAIENYDEKNNELVFNYGSGDSCGAFKNRYKINLNTKKLSLIKSEDLGSCPDELSESIRLAEPTEKLYKDLTVKEKMAEHLVSTNYCGDLTIMNYGQYYPLEIYKGSLKKTIDENIKEREDNYLYGNKVDYEFLGCIEY